MSEPILTKARRSAWQAIDHWPPLAGVFKRVWRFEDSGAMQIEPVPSALSQLDFRVDRLQFSAGIVDSHLPIDATLCSVDVARPCFSFLTQCCNLGEAPASDALPCE